MNNMPWITMQSKSKGFHHVSKKTERKTVLKTMIINHSADSKSRPKPRRMYKNYCNEECVVKDETKQPPKCENDGIVWKRENSWDCDRKDNPSRPWNWRDISYKKTCDETEWRCNKSHAVNIIHERDQTAEVKNCEAVIKARAESEQRDAKCLKKLHSALNIERTRQVKKAAADPM